MYRIYGALGSPYSLKVRAVMRYRRLRHVWIQMGAEHQNVLGRVKAAVIPVVEYPDNTFHNDSTPLIEDLERRHPQERSVMPEDEAQAYLAYLLEDMADEWGTKAMFHYRWHRPRDQKQMSRWLSFDRLVGEGRGAIEAAASAFCDRQVSRMALVGCTPENAPLIEESTRRILVLLEAHVTEERYLFGSRPSLADFGWYGQLSQLAVDPTPAELMRETAPYTLRWLMNLEDASGVEGRWRDPNAALPPAVNGLLALAGEVYLPFLIANAAALEASKPAFQFKALGLHYEQGTFKYQARCLAELRRRFAALSREARERLDPVLEKAKLLEPLQG